MNLTPAQYDLGLGSLGRLPYEVREMILSHLLDVRLHEDYHNRESARENCSREEHSPNNLKKYSAEGLWCPKGEYGLNTEILHASKALHIEASNYLYNSNGMIRLKIPIRNTGVYDPFRFDPFFFFFQSKNANILASQNFLFDVDVDFTDPDVHAQHYYIALSTYQAHTVIHYLSWLLVNDEEGCEIRITLPLRTESAHAIKKFLTPWLRLLQWRTVGIVCESEDKQMITRTAEELKIAGRLFLHQWCVTTSSSLEFIELGMAKRHGSTWRVPNHVRRYCSHIHQCTSPASKPSEDFERFSINMRAGLWSLVFRHQLPIQGFQVEELNSDDVLEVSTWASDSLAELVNKDVLKALVTYGQFHHYLKWIHICLRLCAECMAALGVWKQACIFYTQALDMPFYPRAAADTVDLLRRALEAAKAEYEEETGTAWQRVGEQADWSVVLQQLRQNAQPMDAPLVFDWGVAAVQD